MLLRLVWEYSSITNRIRFLTDWLNISENGQQLLIDIESKTREEIMAHMMNVVGKSRWVAVLYGVLTEVDTSHSLNRGSTNPLGLLWQLRRLLTPSHFFISFLHSKQQREDDLKTKAKDNPAFFGVGCMRPCICMVPGQVPCPGIVPLPDHMRGKFKYNQN